VKSAGNAGKGTGGLHLFLEEIKTEKYNYPQKLDKALRWI
jgi:hypothetical protein